MPELGTRVIDTHHHLWNPADRHYPWMRNIPTLERAFLPADLEAVIVGTPVEATIVVQATSTDEETDWLLECGERCPLIEGVVGWVDLEHEGVDERLATLMSHGALLRGIRHQAQDEPDPEWLLRKPVLAGLEAISEVGLVYELLIRRRETPAALALARRMPGLAFVIDHAAKPDIAGGEWSQWRDSLVPLADLPNVWCKVSGLLTEATPGRWQDDHPERYLQEVVELFGAERCLFGSDWPVSLLQANYLEAFEFAEQATSGLSAAERAAIFGGSAAGLYGLG